ncbi:MAG: thioredoxin [Clostridia bacterium]|nr:thioredoxin [Clostridia bacterium]
MSVHTFNEENFETEVLGTEGTVLVDFYADWCGPCKMMSPIIDEIAEEMQNVKVGKVNVDESGELAMKYNVSSIPTIMVVKNGEVSKTFVGVTEKDLIKEVL